MQLPHTRPTESNQCIRIYRTIQLAMTEVQTATNSRFKNQYMLRYDSPVPESQKSNLNSILKTIDAAVAYLSDYVDWTGRVIDLGVVWRQNPKGQGGGAASIGGMYFDIIKNQDYAYAGTPWGTGQYEGGIMIFLDINGNLTLGSNKYYLSTEPGPQNTIPKGQASFFQTVVHEMLHSMGLVFMEGGDELLSEMRNGTRYIISPTVLSVLPNGLPLSKHDGGSHYVTNLDSPRDEIVFGGNMWDGRINPTDATPGGDSSGGQMLLGKIELALLKDLGYKVYWDETLPLYARLPEAEERKIVEFVDDYFGIESDPITGGGSQYLLSKDSVTRISDFAVDNQELHIPDDLSVKITRSSLYAVAAAINPGAGATKKELKAYKNALKKVKTLEKKIGLTGDPFAYKQSTGEFFVDTNGKQKGFGEGGVLAVLENQPLLGMGNIVF